MSPTPPTLLVSSSAQEAVAHPSPLLEASIWSVVGVCALFALLLVLGHVYRRRRLAATARRDSTREAAEIALTEAMLVLRVGALPTRTFEADSNESAADAHNQPAQLECAVCLAAFENGEKIRKLPCGHEFHACAIARNGSTHHHSCHRPPQR